MINDIELNTKRSEENSKLNSNDDTMESIDLGLDFKIEKDDIVESVNKEDFFRSKNFKLKPTKKSFYFKRMGNTFTFWSNSDGEPLLVIGPHCKIVNKARALLHLLVLYNNFDLLSILLCFLGWLVIHCPFDWVPDLWYANCFLYLHFLKESWHTKDYR